MYIKQILTVSVAIASLAVCAPAPALAPTSSEAALISRDDWKILDSNHHETRRRRDLDIGEGNKNYYRQDVDPNHGQSGDLFRRQERGRPIERGRRTRPNVDGRRTRPNAGGRRTTDFLGPESASASRKPKPAVMTSEERWRQYTAAQTEREAREQRNRNKGGWFSNWFGGGEKGPGRAKQMDVPSIQLNDEDVDMEKLN